MNRRRGNEVWQEPLAYSFDISSGLRSGSGLDRQHQNEKLFYEELVRSSACQRAVVRPALITSDEWSDTAQDQANRFQGGDRRRIHSARGDGNVSSRDRIRTELEPVKTPNRTNHIATLARSVRVQFGSTLAEHDGFCSLDLQAD